MYFLHTSARLTCVYTRPIFCCGCSKPYGSWGIIHGTTGTLHQFHITGISATRTRAHVPVVPCMDISSLWDWEKFCIYSISMAWAVQLKQTKARGARRSHTRQLCHQTQQLLCTYSAATIRTVFSLREILYQYTLVVLGRDFGTYFVITFTDNRASVISVNFNCSLAG